MNAQRFDWRKLEQAENKLPRIDLPVTASLHFRVALKGKTGKTTVLPRFYKDAFITMTDMF